MLGFEFSPKPRQTWLRRAVVLIPLLALNWFAAALLLAPPARTTVSYTFFLDQVQTANVAQVVSAGDAIEGEFTEPAPYRAPGAGTTEPVERFVTRRPPFADDHLFAMLQANGVPVNAGPPDAPAPLWRRLLLGFGPALLIAALLFRLPAARRLGGAV